MPFRMSGKEFFVLGLAVTVIREKTEQSNSVLLIVITSFI